MKKIILVCFLFLNNCYMSYEVVSDEGDEIGDKGDETGDEGEKVSDEVEWVDDLSLNRAIRKLGRLGSEKISESMEPILYFIEPETGCINKDSWFTIYGSRIHWYSEVNMRYPYSGKVEDFREIEWYDNSQIGFKIEKSMNLVSGRYLVKTTDSNEIGFYLEYCK